MSFLSNTGKLPAKQDFSIQIVQIQHTKDNEKHRRPKTFRNIFSIIPAFALGESIKHSAKDTKRLRQACWRSLMKSSCKSNVVLVGNEAKLGSRSKVIACV